MKLLSFHNKQSVKTKYLRRVRAHAKADEIVKGQYWENGKGCAVACIIHGSDHARFETELGVPEWLAHLIDSLFESLPDVEAKAFPESFIASIPVGVDLNPVSWKFCAFLLRENIDRVLSLAIDGKVKEQVVAAVRGVLAVNERAIVAGVWDESAAGSARSAAESAAESAAWSAAWSAGSAALAARSAAWSAGSAALAARSAGSAAGSAALAARSAGSAAESAALAARSAAWSAGSAAYCRYRDELLRLLMEAKP